MPAWCVCSRDRERKGKKTERAFRLQLSRNKRTQTHHLGCACDLHRRDFSRSRNAVYAADTGRNPRATKCECPRQAWSDSTDGNLAKGSERGSVQDHISLILHRSPSLPGGASCRPCRLCNETGQAAGTARLMWVWGPTGMVDTVTNTWTCADTHFRNASHLFFF